ncbi:hypothetical protein HY504_00890 [Candidatus Wolfebacteria bacterium]|nr:hypothetical protein [Candidatus Wolfebacteria bacterium]
MNHAKSERGVSALVLTLLVGGIVMEIALTGLFIAHFLGQSGYGAKLSAEALGAARAGIEDGILKVVRNKNIDYGSSASPYALTVGARTATVSICKDTKTTASPCDTSQAGKNEVTAVGVAFTKQRKLRALLNVNSVTGEVRLEDLREIQL